MKFKVGDKVRVREDLKVGDGFGCTTAVVDMLKYRGKIMTIKEARSAVVGNYTIYEIDDDGESWAWTDEMLEPITRSKFKAGDRVRIKDTGNWDSDIITIGETGTIIEYSISNKVYRVEFDNYNTFKHDCGGCCRKGHGWNCEEKMLEPADSKTLRMADGTIIGECNTIEVLPQKDDTVRGENHFCTGFRGGKIPTPEKPVTIEETAEYFRQQLISNCGVPPMFFSNRSSGKRAALDALVDSYSKLGCTSFLMSRNEIEKIIKEDKPMKFTFYVKEGTRVDKTCNKLIPTMTTFITAESFGDSTYHGAATCDKADYDERQGCLEAIANAVLGGNFDRDFNRAVKANELADKKKRTCKSWGKVFDTVEEREAEEAWHVERKKARRERYLLRKRAKEIAFEEQAQKLAKEMIGEQK